MSCAQKKCHFIPELQRGKLFPGFPLKNRLADDVGRTRIDDMPAGMIKKIDYPDVRLVRDQQPVDAMFRVRFLFRTRVGASRDVKSPWFGSKRPRLNFGAKESTDDARHRRLSRLSSEVTEQERKDNLEERFHAQGRARFSERLSTAKEIFRILSHVAERAGPKVRLRKWDFLRLRASSLY